MISTDWRLLPPWSCHSLQLSRPSTATGRPLERYWAQFSPWAPHTVTSKKLGLSTQLPVASLRRVLTATRSEHTLVPEGVLRSSGSRVRFPVRITRLMFVAAISAASFLFGDRLGSRVHTGSARSGAPCQEHPAMSVSFL